MQISVIFPDQVMVLDGIARKVTFPASLSIEPTWRALQWSGDRGWIEREKGGSLWLKDDSVIKPLLKVYDAAAPADVTPAPDPENNAVMVVSSRQARLLLLSQGLLDQVEEMIAAQDRATKITWEFAAEFRRDDPLLNALAGNLGLTAEQIDQFFIAASAL